jgi:hypothetical protein
MGNAGMSRAYYDSGELDWHTSLREAAVLASDDRGHRLWTWAVVGAGGAAFIALLATIWSRTQLPATPVSELGNAIEQAQRLRSGSLQGDGLFPMAYPLWLLTVSRLTNDLAVAGRVLSALSAVVVLFLAYQICHSLARPSKASEQACFVILALALSPAFFLVSLGGGTELPHLALLFGSVWFIERAIGGRPFVAMSCAGLLAGLSLLIRPISVVAPLAVGLWVWRARPFGEEERWSNLRPALGYAAAFALGTAPRVLLHLVEGTSIVNVGPAELSMVLRRLLDNPAGFVLGSGSAVLQYVAADDLERVAAVSGFWSNGQWGNGLSALVALGPTLLKALGVAALFSLCWEARFEAQTDRASLPALTLLLVALGAGLGLVPERGALLVQVLLITLAFAGLPSVLPGAANGFVGLGLIGLLVFNQLGTDYPVELTTSYQASDRVSTELKLAKAAANAVMSSSWVFYDTSTAYHERYTPIPIQVDSVSSLVAEMRRQGFGYLVLDRNSVARFWPRLTPLLDDPQPREGLRLLKPAFRADDGGGVNWVGVYQLD